MLSLAGRLPTLGVRHLAFLLLTDPSLSGAQIAYDVASRPAELGLPPVPVRKVAVAIPTGARGQDSPVRFAAAWAVFDAQEDTAADRICSDGAEKGRLYALKQLAPARGYIRGRLVDSSGNPPSAEWVTAGRGMTVASSARDGTYCIGVPSLGNYIVRPLSPDRVAVPHARSAAISRQNRRVSGELVLGPPPANVSLVWSRLHLAPDAIGEGFAPRAGR